MKEDFTNIDKKFIDRAWADMTRQLDETMPTVGLAQKRKRRFGLFWMFFIGLLMGGVGTFYLLNPTIETTIISAFKIPILGNKATTQPLIATNLLDEVRNTNTITTTQATKNKPTASFITNLSNSSNPTSKKSLVKMMETSLTEPLENRTIRLIKEEKQTIKEELSIARASNKEVTIPHLLARKEIEQLSVMSGDGLPRVETVPKEASKPFTLGINAGGIYGNAWKGAYAGVTLSKPFANKFLWSLGLGLSRQNKQETLNNTNPNNGLTTSETDDYYVEYEGGTISQQDPSTIIEEENLANLRTTIIPTDLVLNYVHLNLGLDYQLSPRWQINSGVMVSSLLSSPSDYTEGGIFSDKRSLDTAFAGSSAVDLSSAENLSLRLIDLASTIGISFYATRKISIQGGYHHGFINFKKNTSVKKYNRFFTLGVQYQFSR